MKNIKKIPLVLIILSLVLTGLWASGSREKEPANTAAERAAGAEEKAPGDEPLKESRSAERGPDGILSDPGTPPVNFYKDFRTDFGRSAVYYGSIIPGGAPREGIPALSLPHFTSVERASEWMDDREAVLLLRYDKNVRVYPVQILMWHEVVNDRIGDVPVGVSYAPLSNTAIAFLREGFDEVLSFGTTGLLRFSNPVMYDRETESWWQQATGKGIVGEYAGEQLELLPVSLLPWKEIEDHYGDAYVMSRLTGYEWPYGQNAYEGYDRSDEPFLYVGPDLDAEVNTEFSLMERVIAVGAEGAESSEGGVKAYSYGQLREQRVISDSLNGRRFVLFWQPGTSSPVDSLAVAAGRDVGSAQAYFPVVNTREADTLERDGREADSRELSFFWDGEQIRDRETGSEWSVSGLAVSGELEGTQLAGPVSFNHFGYSWSVFKGEY